MLGRRTSTERRMYTKRLGLYLACNRHLIGRRRVPLNRSLCGHRAAQNRRMLGTHAALRTGGATARGGMAQLSRLFSISA